MPLVLRSARVKRSARGDLGACRGFKEKITEQKAKKHRSGNRETFVQISVKNKFTGIKGACARHLQSSLKILLL